MDKSLVRHDDQRLAPRTGLGIDHLCPRHRPPPGGPGYLVEQLLGHWSAPVAISHGERITGGTAKLGS
jgi:hypothetical protein